MIEFSFIQGFEEPIEIDEVRYGIFELIMLWLYSGGDAEMRVEENELVEVKKGTEKMLQCAMVQKKIKTKALDHFRFLVHLHRSLI